MSMPGGNGSPGEGMGNGFLRSKVEKRGIKGLMVFITELLPVSRWGNVMPVAVEDDQDARARLGNVITNFYHTYF